MKYNYLGIVTSSDGDLVEEIRTQANKANRMALENGIALE
jgi:hypothetical protein